MGRVRILLVDDHELFREGLANLIEAQPDLEVVGQAGDGFEALTLARDLEPDLIVMDITMPLCDGVEATRRIRALNKLSKTQIIMLTILDEDEKLFAAIQAGANGYLLKNTSSNDFLLGLRGALQGKAALPPKLAARLVDEFTRLSRQQPRSAPPPEVEFDLSPRQHEVLSLITTGATDKEIAAQLSLSLYTVKSHVRTILSKLQVANRRQAANLAREQGLTKDE